MSASFGAAIVRARRRRAEVEAASSAATGEAPLIAKTLMPAPLTKSGNGDRGGSNGGETGDSGVFGRPAGSSAPLTELLALEVMANTPQSFIQRRVSKAEMAARLRLPLRDLRVVDPSFRNEAPVVLARERAIVVHLLHVRAVIEVDRMTLFDAEHPAVEAFLPHLQARLAVSSRSPPAFELRALEAVLVDVCNTLTRDTNTLSPQIEAMLMALTGPTAHSGTGQMGTAPYQDVITLDRLLPLKNRLNELQTRSVQIRSALNDVLLNDDDMTEMYLSVKSATGHRRRVDDHEEVEMMFENYLKQVDTVNSEIATRVQAIGSTEDFVQIKLDALRNRILRLDLVLKLGSVSLSSGALVAAIFGMNLNNALEGSEMAFLGVTGGLVGISSAMFLGGAAYCRYKRLL